MTWKFSLTVTIAGKYIFRIDLVGPHAFRNKKASPATAYGVVPGILQELLGGWEFLRMILKTFMDVERSHSFLMTNFGACIFVKSGRPS